MKKGWMLALALAVIGTAGAADAQRREKQGDFNVLLRGGVGDYTGALSDVTSAGPTWAVTVNVQPWNVLGYELTYDGSRNLVNDDRFQSAPALTRHGVTGLIRLAPPFIEKVRPFVGAGVGASLVQVSGDEQSLYQNDLMQEVPVTGGIEFNTGAVTAGLRTSYRWLIDESFADPAVASGNPQGGYLDAQLSLGGRF